ncbi:hypothetical protein R6Q57_000103 [Mikania cordata]
MALLCLIFIVTIVTAVASPIDNQIHLIMPHSGSAGLKHSDDINCLSWRLAIETDNLQGWTQIPRSCVDYVGNYMLGKQYRDDCEYVAAEAYEYAKGLNLTGDGKDVMLPYNSTSFDEWVAKAVAPAVPGSVKLYEQLIELGFKIVFLTGTKEPLRIPRIKNLKAVGYTECEKLILKIATIVLKSKIRRSLGPVTSTLALTVGP